MNQVKKKKKIVWQQYIGFAFMMFIGAICGVVVVSYFDKANADTALYQERFSLVGLFLCMYVALFFHIIVHEAA